MIKLKDQKIFPPNSGHSEVFVDSNGIQRCDQRATEKADTLSGTCIQGRGANDILTATGINTHLFGDQGNDHIIGSENRDRLHGSNGNDKIDVKGGDDIIFGDRDNDKMRGPGADLFHCGPGNDMIIDYNEPEGDQRKYNADEGYRPDCKLQVR
jgi:Ca2+-binding RTX toxin-like protein